MQAAASELVIAVQQSDGLEIEAVFQSPGSSFDVPVLTSPSGWQRCEQAVAQVVDVLDDLFGPYTAPGSGGPHSGIAPFRIQEGMNKSDHFDYRYCGVQF